MNKPRRAVVIAENRVIVKVDYFPSFCSKKKLFSGLGLSKIECCENFTIYYFDHTDRQKLRASLMNPKSQISDDN